MVNLTTYIDYLYLIRKELRAINATYIHKIYYSFCNCNLFSVAVGGESFFTLSLFFIRLFFSLSKCYRYRALRQTGRAVWTTRLYWQVLVGILVLGSSLDFSRYMNQIEIIVLSVAWWVFESWVPGSYY